MPLPFRSLRRTPMAITPTEGALALAHALAAHAGLPTDPWTPHGFSLPSAVTFLGDDTRLVAVVLPGGKPRCR